MIKGTPFRGAFRSKSDRNYFFLIMGMQARTGTVARISMTMKGSSTNMGAMARIEQQTPAMIRNSFSDMIETSGTHSS